MQSLKILPNIKYLLENNKEQEAINIITPNIDTLALYLKDCLGLFTASTKESSLCLSKIHFINQNYDQSIKFAIKAGNLFLEDKTFFYKALVDRMMSCLLIDTNHFCKPFILDLIKNDILSDSYIGFLFSIKEYELFEMALSKQMSNKDLLSFLINEIQDKNMFYKSIINIQNKETEQALFLLIDAYAYFNMTAQLKNLLLEMESKDICLCYTLCFYIDECYKLDLQVENQNMMRILNGTFKKEIFNKFRVENNLTSFKLLDSMTKSLTSHVSFVNSFMNLGTTNDTFYRNNSDVFGRLNEWARYLDVANLGMIHYKNDNPYDVLKNYIPNESNNKEGGSLQALGLINNGSYNEADNELLLYFLDSIDTLTDELAFGSCMGLGLINIGSNNKYIISALIKLAKEKNTIYGEAATIGMGLIGCGTCEKELLDQLRCIEEDTEYQRVIRSIGIANALLVAFTRKEYNFTNKFGDVLSLGTAFVGTGSLEIISKVLPFINHEDDDVKRNAIIALGFICCMEHSLLLDTLEPLAENHNNAVRSAVGLVLGFFFSGTGNERVCDLLEGLMYDTNSLVKQSALIGMGFVIMQCNDTLIKNYKRIIGKFNKVIVDRSEEGSVKFGAVIGRGISEAGGRSIIFSITNMFNKITKERLVGALMFFNYWYWYPYINFISLNLKETGFFVFDEDLQLVDKSLKYNGNYDNILIKVPDVKKSRKFKAKPAIEEEIITKADENIQSGKRCTLLQMKECGIEFPGVFFTKK